MTLPPLPLLRRVSCDLQDLYALSSTASDSRGQASSAHEPKSRSVRHASARRGTGSTQRKVPPTRATRARTPGTSSSVREGEEERRGEVRKEGRVPKSR